MNFWCLKFSKNAAEKLWEFSAQKCKKCLNQTNKETLSCQIDPNYRASAN